MSGVTIVRTAGKTVSGDYLSKVTGESNTSMGLAVATTNGSHIEVRKILGGFTENAQKLFNHPSLLNRKILVGFGTGAGATSLDDVQPYPVLNNAEGKPLIVAFLNGDFSQFTRDEETSSPEQNCVRIEVIPRVAKAYKYAKEDLHETMNELKDPITMRDWSYFMLGDKGCITLMAANGDVNHILVPGEDISGDIEGGWSTNTFPVPQPKVEPVDDLAAALGDAGTVPPLSTLTDKPAQAWSRSGGQ